MALQVATPKGDESGPQDMKIDSSGGPQSGILSQGLELGLEEKGDSGSKGEDAGKGRVGGLEVDLLMGSIISEDKLQPGAVTNQ